MGKLILKIEELIANMGGTRPQIDPLLSCNMKKILTAAESILSGNNSTDELESIADAAKDFLAEVPAPSAEQASTSEPEADVLTTTQPRGLNPRQLSTITEAAREDTRAMLRARYRRRNASARTAGEACQC